MNYDFYNLYTDYYFKDINQYQRIQRLEKKPQSLPSFIDHNQIFKKKNFNDKKKFNNQKYDAAVDVLTKAADEWNQTVRAYKAQ